MHINTSKKEKNKILRRYKKRKKRRKGNKAKAIILRLCKRIFIQKEIIIQYQDLMEFYADTSGLLLSFFWILGVILAYYDRIVTNHSISKRLFYFEGIKNNNFEQLRIIKELIKKKEEQEEKSKEENNEKNKENDNNIQNENRRRRKDL